MSLEGKVNKTLYVAGNFNDPGKPSKIANQVFKIINPGNAKYLNGGNFQDLSQTLQDIEQYNLIFWFADVPNNKPKLVNEIKKKHKKCILVTSKRNFDNEYSFQDLLYHAITIKSNLIVIAW